MTAPRPAATGPRPSSDAAPYTVGVDFGTASARAVLVDVGDGREIGLEVHLCATTSTSPATQTARRTRSRTARYVRPHDLFGRGVDPAMTTLKRLRLEAEAARAPLRWHGAVIDGSA